MAPVNWERQPGETVEEFVEALILTTANPRATRITPSRGDKGLDIIAPIGDAFDIYQVKRFTRPFGKSSSQEKSIISSWQSFVRDILPNYSIRRWHLVMPWNPTPERYEWMLSVLTKGATIERDWIGRGQLDVWTSQNPALQDYYFGNGQGRTLELIASALASRDETPELTGQPLIDAVAAREISLSKQLDSVDPFYRYESTIKRGQLAKSPQDQIKALDQNAAFVTLRQIDDDNYLQLAVYPKCVDAFRLRPISTTVSIDALDIDDDTLRAAHEMIEYGAEPEKPIPVQVVETKGPPGTDNIGGSALMYVFNVSQQVSAELELRHGERRLGFTDIVTTHGKSGIRMTGRDKAGVLELVIILDHFNATKDVTIRTLPIGGKLPHIAIDGLEFVDQWSRGRVAELAIPFGRPLLSLGSLPPSSIGAEAADWLRICQNLVRLQSISVKQLLVPVSLSGGEERNIDIAVRLLNGEIVQSEWISTQFVVKNADALHSNLSSGPLFQFLIFTPLSIEYDDIEYELDGTLGTWGVAQLADPTIADSLAPGDSVTIVPGPDQKLFRQYSPKPLDTMAIPGFEDA